MKELFNSAEQFHRWAVAMLCTMRGGSFATVSNKKVERDIAEGERVFGPIPRSMLA